MKYIFIDESGDLGSKKASSRWFLFAAVITSDGRALDRVIKKVWKILKRRHKRRGELHAYHEEDNIRRKVFREINKNKSINIICLALDKEQGNETQNVENKIIYNSSINYLIQYICRSDLIVKGEQIDIIIDQTYTKDDVVSNLHSSIIDTIGKNNIKSYWVTFEPSHGNKSLQAVDFISWALFQKFERNNKDYISLLDNIDIDIHVLPIKRMLPR